MYPRTYRDCLAFLAKGRSKTDRPLDRHTRLVKEGEEISVVLHNTAVFTYLSPRRIRLRSGGYKTVTTKDRINKALPPGWTLYQEKGVWLLSALDKSIPFEEDLVIPVVPTLRWAMARVRGTQEVVAQERKLRQKILKYSKDFAEAIIAGKIPTHWGSDCWKCATNDPSTGHLLSHLEEPFYSLSLLNRAMKDAGETQYIRERVWELINHGPVSSTHGHDSLMRNGVVQAVKKYLYTRLNLVR
jgi:hypothetical protein